MSRTLIVGDVHGCLAELDALLVELEPRAGDRFVFVGDLVDRGPDSVGVVRRVRELCARYPGSACVAGNHEAKALRGHDRGVPGRPWTVDASDEDWAFLDALPLVWRDPALGAVVVHGGFYPAFFEVEGPVGDVPADWRRSKTKRAQRLQRFLYVRQVKANGNMLSLDQCAPEHDHWTDRYDGREGFAFFGHDPQLEPAEPLVTPHALGLDTGCCFGGRLTAAVVKGDARRYALVSVPAYGKYAEPLRL
ncbi:MAG: metallophosphoesterase [Planctomycetes bacterium]|nr:metallophosphoesterase [Planctomycetota bacterium]